MSPDPELFVQSLARGLSVIRSFDADNPSQTVAEVARRTGLTRAAARRFLHTLVELGYVHFSEGVFRLRPRVLELGNAYMSSLSIPGTADIHMKALCAALGETVSLAVLDGTEIIYVGRALPDRLMTVNIPIGTRLPAYCTAMGRALLTGLPDEHMQQIVHASDLLQRGPATLTDPQLIILSIRRSRRLGYVLVDEEFEVGLRAIAMPIYSGPGAPVASINVSTPARRGSARSLVTDILPRLQLAVRAIEADLTP